MVVYTILHGGRLQSKLQKGNRLLEKPIHSLCFVIGRLPFEKGSLCLEIHGGYLQFPFLQTNWRRSIIGLNNNYSPIAQKPDTKSRFILPHFPGMFVIGR